MKYKQGFLKQRMKNSNPNVIYKNNEDIRINGLWEFKYKNSESLKEFLYDLNQILGEHYDLEFNYHINKKGLNCKLSIGELLNEDFPILDKPEKKYDIINNTITFDVLVNTKELNDFLKFYSNQIGFSFIQEV